MTGDPNRSLKLPFPDGIRPNMPKTMSYDSLKFPACEKCNVEFSNLEAQVKDVVNRMLVSSELSRDEIVILLEWLDKVRTGLWLGGLYYQ